MKTQEWRSSNAPNGPSLWIRCAKCGEKGIRLEGGVSIVYGNRGVQKESRCTNCGETIKYRVSDE